MKKRFYVRVLFALLWFASGAAAAAALAFTFLEEPRACAISVDKVNVMYQGIDNPLHVVVRGVPEEQVRIEGEGITLTSLGHLFYSARVTTAQNEARIRVSGGDLKPVEFRYRIKKFPDPDVRLGKFKGGPLSAGAFKAQGGVSAVMTGMDICGNCDTKGYNLTRISGKGDPITCENTGARYNPHTQDMINLAQPGDIYFFDDIRVMCPGDGTARNLGSMKFKIQ
jgi:hypothetical protein